MFRNARPTDAARGFEIETTAYEGEEAATLAKISKQVAAYLQGFLSLEIDGEISGFINSGCAHEVEISDEDLTELIGHDPDAPNGVIMSVVVDPGQQGKGHSRALMTEFTDRMNEMGKATIHPICKARHVPHYEKQ